MDLKGLCVPIKISLSLLSLLFIACSSHNKPRPYMLDENRTSSCQNEIEQTISTLIHAKNLQISKDIFSKTSLLNLTNRKNGALKPSPIFNDRRGRKTLLLYKQKNHLYLGLINEKKDILKSKALKECH